MCHSLKTILLSSSLHSQHHDWLTRERKLSFDTFNQEVAGQGIIVQTCSNSIALIERKDPGTNLMKMIHFCDTQPDSTSMALQYHTDGSLCGTSIVTPSLITALAHCYGYLCWFHRGFVKLLQVSPKCGNGIKGSLLRLLCASRIRVCMICGCLLRISLHETFQ